jgi:hypothetical protein
MVRGLPYVAVIDKARRYAHSGLNAQTDLLLSEIRTGLALALRLKRAVALRICRERLPGLLLAWPGMHAEALPPWDGKPPDCTVS